MKELLATLVEWGASGLFLAALLDGAGVPVPSGVDVLIVYLASRKPNQIITLSTLAVLGSVLGNMLLFAVARRGGRMFLDKRTSGNKARFRRWFDRYGLLTVFVSALVPLPIMPMKIFVLCSGALGASPLHFLIVFLTARVPRYLGLALLGRQMGADAMGWLGQHVWHLVFFAALLFTVLLLLMQYADRRSKATASLT